MQHLSGHGEWIDGHREHTASLFRENIRKHKNFYLKIFLTAVMIDYSVHGHDKGGETEVNRHK